MYCIEFIDIFLKEILDKTVRKTFTENPIV